MSRLSIATLGVFLALLAVSSTTPTGGKISDHSPRHKKLSVPSLVIRAIAEVQERGKICPNLYLNDDNADLNAVKVLRDEFVRFRLSPKLHDVTVPTICTLLKTYLDQLSERLVPLADVPYFINALESKESKASELRDAVVRLPQANRDTLALLMEHFKWLVEDKDCTSTAHGFAEVFAPILFGPNGHKEEKIRVIEALLDLDVQFYQELTRPLAQLKHSESSMTLYAAKKLFSRWRPNLLGAKGKHDFSDEVKNTQEVDLEASIAGKYKPLHQDKKEKTSDL